MRKWQIWMTLRLSGIKIPKEELQSISESGKDASELVNALLLLKDSGLKSELSFLISYWQKGGDVLNVATGLIFAKNQNYQLDLKEAIRMDKNGKSISTVLAKRITMDS
ncbi:MAG TPA: hypothetical protein VJ939_09960, partial [Bacteroidales bacterium]|nr:hypothetical protein [Bacteroidales bacterium]